MKKVFLSGLLAAAVAGCAAENSYSRLVVLQHPETKQTVDCKYPEMASVRLSSHIDTCVATYEKAGYRVVSDSARP